MACLTESRVVPLPGGVSGEMEGGECEKRGKGRFQLDESEVGSVFEGLPVYTRTFIRETDMVAAVR